MRRRSYIGRDSGKGIGIFFIIIVALPILNYVFSLLDFLLSNVGFILYMIGLVFIVGLVTYFTSSADEDEEEEM